MNEAKVRRLLERELCAIRARLGQAEGVDVRRGDEADRSSASTEHELGGMSRERLLLRAQRFEAALERLREGNYGICTHCDHPIAPARLQAMPEVETCVPCQERLERQRRAEGEAFGYLRLPRRPIEELEQ